MSAIATAWRKTHQTPVSRSSKPTHDRRRLRGAYEGDTQNRYLEDWIIGDRQPRELTAVTLTILRQRRASGSKRLMWSDTPWFTGQRKAKLKSQS